MQVWFDRDAGKFFWFVLLFLQTLAYFTLFGIMAVCITPSVALANVFCSFFFGFFNLLCGFLIPRALIPGWWIWYYYINPVAWSLYGMVVTQLGDFTNETITGT